MISAHVVPLEFWQDPQSDVILIFGEWECSVYFRCWTSAGTPADFIGHLSFVGSSAVRSFHREYCPYQPEEHNHSSYILRVEDSDLARDYVEYRKLHYPRSEPKSMTHYVVVGHDIYHEILARSFTASAIPNNQVSDVRLLNLISGK